MQSTAEKPQNYAFALGIVDLLREQEWQPVVVGFIAQRLLNWFRVEPVRLVTLLM